MKDFCVRDIVCATGGRLLCGDDNTEITNFATNSSKAEPGFMFAPIVGERVDGHKYIESAFECGASAALTQSCEAVDALILGWKEKGIAAKPIVLVDDSVRAMQLAAREYESRLSLKKVGVTGSVGKTTTKEMIACALSGGLKVFKTAGNANSQIGVPVTLMNIAPDDEAAVIEMGMSEKGEMERLATLLSLNAAVMTNIGVSHIEQLGSQENILREKWHITDALVSGGCIFLNGDDALLKERAKQCKDDYASVFGSDDNRKLSVVTFGHDEGCDYRAENVFADENGVVFDMVHGSIRMPVKLKVLGSHNVNNALVALAVAQYFGVELKMAVAALGQYTGVAMRQQITKKDGVIYIDDSYNASPDSMKAGLSVLSQMPAEHRIAVLADMLELGENTREYHRLVGEYAGQSNVDELLLYGELAAYIGYGAEQYVKNIRHFDTLDDIKEYLKNTLKPNMAVLFKGSRGMKLNEVVDALIS